MVSLPCSACQPCSPRLPRHARSPAQQPDFVKPRLVLHSWYYCLSRFTFYRLMRIILLLVLIVCWIYFSSFLYCSSYSKILLMDYAVYDLKWIYSYF
jgi:hypothetical protein